VISLDGGDIPRWQRITRDDIDTGLQLEKQKEYQDSYDGDIRLQLYKWRLDGRINIRRPKA
jgi:hypothetical protein